MEDRMDEGRRGARRRSSCACCGASRSDGLARETGQPAGQISAWREEFLAAGREGLKSRSRPEEDRRLIDAQRKIGELSMDNEILKGLLEEVEHRPRRPRR